MEDRLSCVFVAIYDDPIARYIHSFFFSDIFRGQHEVPDEVCIFVAQIGQARDVPLRKNKDVDRRLWFDIIEGDDVGVLVNYS